MASIEEYLNKIKSAVYGEEVRGSIIGAIEKCYSDVKTNVQEVLNDHPEWATTVQDKSVTLAKLADEVISQIDGKLDKSNVTNTLTTTSSGYALDARQGKNLHEESVKRYTGTATLAQWTLGDYYDSTYKYAQIVTPDVAISNDAELSQPMTRLTENTETNETLRENINLLCGGVWKSYNGKIYIYVAEKPTCDLDLVFYGKEVEA